MGVAIESKLAATVEALSLQNTLLKSHTRILRTWVKSNRASVSRPTTHENLGKERSTGPWMPQFDLFNQTAVAVTVIAGPL